jgi:signal transduction histidine kinase
MTRRPLTRIGSSPLDAAIAAVVVLLGQLEVWLSTAIHPKGAAAASELVLGLALAWRRRFPLGAFLLIVVADVAEPLAGVPLQAPGIPPVASIIAFYTLVTRADWARVGAGAAAMTAGCVIMQASQDHGMGGLVFQLALLLGTGLVGTLVRRSTARAGALQRRTSQLEREGEQRAAAAIEDERRRIARELHDIISHSLSVVVLQAGAAEQVLAADPERAREVLHSIRATGQQAIAEMGTLLSLAHGEPDSSREPQPSLADIDRLVAKTREAGLPVELNVEGAQQELPPALELSAFRIVQEGLTNALKHAGGPHAQPQVRVRIRYALRELEVEVGDDGNGSSSGSGGRRGLAGVAERVAVFGGRFEAGPRPEGGWTLLATFPLSR